MTLALAMMVIVASPVQADATEPTRTYAEPDAGRPEIEDETRAETEAETEDGDAITEDDEGTDDDAPDPTPRRVLLLSTGSIAGEGGLGARLRRASAELEVGGFAPLLVSLTNDHAEITTSTLSELSREHQASAIIVFDSQRAYAELWKANEDGATRIAIVVGDAVADDNDAILAVRLTEVLQASLLEIATRPAPPPPTPVAAAVPTEEPKGPRWAARVGLHGIGSAERVGVMLGPVLGATVALGRRRGFGLDVEALSTALLGEVQDPAGRATVGIAALRAIAQWWPIPGGRFSPAIGAGIGPLLAWTRGSAVAPFISRTDVTVVSVPTGAADLAIRVAPRLRLRLAIRVGVALPSLRIRAPESTTVVGRPLFDGGIALELMPPRRRP